MLVFFLAAFRNIRYTVYCVFRFGFLEVWALPFARLLP